MSLISSHGTAHLENICLLLELCWSDTWLLDSFNFLRCFSWEEFLRIWQQILPIGCLLGCWTHEDTAQMHLVHWHHTLQPLESSRGSWAAEMRSKWGINKLLGETLYHFQVSRSRALKPRGLRLCLVFFSFPSFFIFFPGLSWIILSPKGGGYAIYIFVYICCFQTFTFLLPWV